MMVVADRQARQAAERVLVSQHGGWVGMMPVGGAECRHPSPWTGGGALASPSSFSVSFWQVFGGLFGEPHISRSMGSDSE